MKSTLLILILHFTINILNSNAQVPPYEWAESAGGKSSDVGNSIGVDADGNSYVTGSFKDTVMFGSIQHISNGNEDFFLAKYNVAGTVLWVRTAGYMGLDIGKSVAVDASGNCYVTGTFSYDSIRFGNQVFPIADAEDVFTVKYDSSGVVLWAAYGTGPTFSPSRSIDFDAAGNCYITGAFQGSTITFGGITLNNAGQNDLFMVKYNSSGVVVWARSIGSTGNESGNGIAVNNAGIIYVTGYFNSPSVSFGSTVLTNTGSGTGDFFIAKFDSSGNSRWAIRGQGSFDDFGIAIALDASENIFVTGWFKSNSLQLGSVNVGSNFTFTQFDVFIVKVDSAGVPLWGIDGNGSSNEASYAISTDSEGSCYTIGYFTGGMSFDTVAANALSGTGPEVFVVKLDSAGNVVWTTSEGSAGSDYGYGITTDVTGSNYITGSYTSTSVSFDTFTINNAGTSGSDIFIAKMQGIFTTEVNEIRAVSDALNIFPNPTHNTFTISFNGLSSMVDGQLQIFDVMGREVHQQIITSAHQHIENSFSPGIYFVKVSDGEKQYLQKLVIE
jgi:hypothetical protein